MSKTYKIGEYSAYAIAVKHGYTGTEEEWIAAVEAARKSAEKSAEAAAEELTKVQTAGAEAVDAISAQQTTSVNAVKTQQTTSVNTVNEAGQKQLSAIQEVEDDIKINYPKYDEVIEDNNSQMKLDTDGTFFVYINA